MTTHDKRSFNYIGMLFTICMSFWFIVLSWQWFTIFTPHPISADELFVESKKAYGHLQQIAEAQSRYIKKDWDSDGLLSYAPFCIHLFQSVDLKGKPVRVNFISKKLGFAMGPTKAVDGYYFLDIRKRVTSDNELHSLDYQKEWAIIAAPAINKEIPALYFIADQSGKLYAKKLNHFPTRINEDLPAQGWEIVHHMNDLDRIFHLSK